MSTELLQAATGGFTMWATYAIIIATIIAYATDRWPIEQVSLIVLCALLILFSFHPGIVAPMELVSGFANPALVTVLALMVVGQALYNTDALDPLAQWLSRSPLGGRRLMIVLLLALPAAISAFLNNTPVVVMFIPILTLVARQRNLGVAQILMPLSFASILGGMTTLIGSSTNLLVAGVAQRAGIDIGFFDITVPGLILAGVGMIHVLFVMPLMLADRPGMIEEIKTRSGKQFISEIVVTSGHPLEGATSRAGLFREMSGLTVRAIVRNDIPIPPPFEDVTLTLGDTVIVAATRAVLTRVLAKDPSGMAVNADIEDGEVQDEKLEPHYTLAEAVVAPGSRYVSRTIADAGIRANDGVAVLGIQRKSHMQRAGLADIRLEPGDTVLIGGTPEDVARLRSSRDLLLLEWSKVAVPMRRLAPVAMSVFAAMVVAAAFSILPIMTASLLAATAMIVTGCINVRQAARAFDSRIFMMVGASLASAVALEKTGGAQYLASLSATLLEGLPVSVSLSVFFLSVAVLTNILSNNATAVLFTPIAISIARELGADPMAFVAAVIFASNCSFATPVGYQTNLLVMGPGHYRFSDFLKAGVPLVILMWLTYSFVGPWYYGT
ncbi:MAG: SLC13 family permease [Rhizobiaceae bacterium]